MPLFLVKEEEVNCNEDEWKELESRWEKLLFKKKFKLFNISSKLVYYRADLGTRSLFPSSLSANFLSMDRYCSSPHFANFQVRSSLSQKPVVRSWKRALKRSIAPKFTVVRSVCIVCMYVCIGPPTPAWRQIIHTVQAHTTYETVGKREKMTIRRCFA